MSMAGMTSNNHTVFIFKNMAAEVCNSCSFAKTFAHQKKTT
jgi:hypothetical protein